MSQWRCLAIETATEQASVALEANGQTFTRAMSQGRNSSREIYAVTQTLLEEAGIVLAELDCVACGLGPGSFTGVRVAVAATMSLGYSLDRPVVGVSTLAALAHAAGRQGIIGDVAPCLDARMGEIYVGLYRCAAGELPAALTDDQLLAPDDVQFVGQPGHVMGVGPGWEAYPGLLDRGIVLAQGGATLWPTASAVLELAAARYRAGEQQAAATLLPNYLRDKVASKTRS